jgi:hypothetical protein
MRVVGRGDDGSDEFRGLLTGLKDGEVVVSRKKMSDC